MAPVMMAPVFFVGLIICIICGLFAGRRARAPMCIAWMGSGAGCSSRPPSPPPRHAKGRGTHVRACMYACMYACAPARGAHGAQVCKGSAIGTPFVRDSAAACGGSSRRGHEHAFFAVAPQHDDVITRVHSSPSLLPLLPPPHPILAPRPLRHCSVLGFPPVLPARGRTRRPRGLLLLLGRALRGRARRAAG